MPIHIVSQALASVVALDTYPVILAAIFAVVFLKQWSSGVDLLGQLDRAASAPEREIDDDKGSTLVKKRKVKARDLHGTVVLIVVSAHGDAVWQYDMLHSTDAEPMKYAGRIHVARSARLFATLIARSAVDLTHTLAKVIPRSSSHPPASRWHF
jgi:hypothetical protein